MARSFTPESLPDLSGRVYIVTGGNAGIGYHTVLHLAKHNAKIYLACRNSSKGTQAIMEMRETVLAGTIEVLPMDLMNFASVVSAGKSIIAKEPALHDLLNSAGIMATPYEVTGDGFEAQIQTNYLSHWLLTYHLLPLMQKTAASSPAGNVRIVNVSSMGHNAASGINFENINLPDVFTFRRYAQSKLANILHSNALERHFGPSRTSQGDDTGEIWIASLHPGNVDTNLNRNSWGGSSVAPIIRRFGGYIKPEEGAYTSLFAVASDELKRDNSGRYWVPFGNKKEPSKTAKDGELAKRLWEWTEKEMTRRGLI